MPNQISTDGPVTLPKDVPDGYDDVSDGMADAAASALGLPMALVMDVLNGGDFNERDVANFLNGLRERLEGIAERGYDFQ